MRLMECLGESDPDYITSTSPIVKEELGIVLLPSNILAQSSENLYQSVFYKLETPMPPPSACTLPCNPDLERIKEIVLLNQNETCWNQMTIVKLSTIDITTEESEYECFLQCLLNLKCEVVSYDMTNKQCWTQDRNYYRQDLVDTTVRSKTALLECILDHFNESRASLCQNRNELYERVLEPMKSNHEKDVDRLIQKFMDVKRAYSLDVKQLNNHSNNSRNKRSWEAFDFLSDIPIVNHFYEILKSPAENKKIRAHLKSLEKRFKAFAIAVQTNVENTRKFQEAVLEIIEVNIQSLNEKIFGLKCDVASLGILITYQQRLQHHIAKLEEMVFAPRHGRLQASIPQTLTMKDLQLIVTNNVNYKSTLYQQHPEVLYRVGHLYLLELSKANTHLLFHFLLIAPKLQLSGLHRTYTPVKVPITAKTIDVCFEANLPPTILLKEGNFYAADTTDCNSEDDITFCQQDFEDRFSPSLQAIPCLDTGADASTCPMIEVPCENKMVFTKAGALVYSRLPVLAMRRHETSKLEVISQSNSQFSYFLKWTDFSMVQTDRSVMYALDNGLTVKSLKWKSPDQAVQLDRYLEVKSLESFNKNVSNLKKLLENTTDIVFQEFQDDYMGLGVTKNKFQEICSTVSIILTILSVLVFIGLCCWKRVQKHSEILRAALRSVNIRRQEERELRERMQYVEMSPVPRVIVEEAPVLHCEPKNVRNASGQTELKMINKGIQTVAVASNTHPVTPPIVPNVNTYVMH